MAPKLKPSKSEWQQCNTCKIIVSTKDVDQHESCCLRRECERDTDLKLPHDHITSSTLHGTVRELPDKFEDVAELPASIKSRLVFLNPSCMRICKIGLKDNVAVTLEDGTTSLYVAWPVKNIGLTSVCFVNCKKIAGKRAAVKRYSNCIVGAKAITVVANQEVQKELMSDIPKCLLTQNRHSIRAGSTLLCRLYGQELTFKVAEVIGEDGSTSSSCDDVPEVERKMMSLALDDTDLEPEHEDDLSDSLLESTPVRAPRLISANFSTPMQQTTWQDSSREAGLPAFYLMKGWTKISVVSEMNEAGKDVKQTNYNDIGGLEEEIRSLRELIEAPVKFPQTFAKFGLKPPRGALLYGPPGTGKTMLARAVAAEARVNFVTINGPEIFSKFYGETEAALRDIFRDAVEKSPSIVFIDEIDALCPKRETGISDQEARVVSTLVTLIDTLPVGEGKWAIVLGATNKPNSLDPSIRQPGRLDREIEIGVPTVAARQDILRKILKNVKHSLTDQEISDMAEMAHGLTGADLSAVCSEAALHAMERHIGGSHLSDAQLSQVISVDLEDFTYALKRVKPSAMREVMLEIPKIRWSDIGGMAEVKLKLKQAVEWPQQHRDAFERLGIRPPHGLLLYGPPGCSKTMIAKALATESGLNFIAIKGPELFSKWVGDSERAVREVFRKARAASPCVVFFDEIDALAAQRGSTKSSSNVGDRVIAQLLAEIDGIEQLEDVVLVAATNRPDMVDEAMLRPGRLDSIIYVPLPDLETRKEILRINLNKRPVDQDVDLDELAQRTEGYSGAEVVAVCQEAAMKALEEDITATAIRKSHFEMALKVVMPRISKETIQFYESYKASGKGVNRR
ncbi:ATPase family gene 2 protein homolog A-like [Ornithodoros turicata]|uniref:ATPase family gene 2 protein homolog A-like n=1 Tax=Ornithodoros turicata TaxID=34597 RepID=UPI003139DC22